MSEETLAKRKNIKEKIIDLQLEIEELTASLQQKEEELFKLKKIQKEQEEKEEAKDDAEAKVNKLPVYNCSGLSSDEISRYSRQMILPNFGIKGQLLLKDSSFLIIGIGGLGCPAAQYLAAAGCGRLGLVDYDDVENSNISRQILHNEYRIGMAKVESAFASLKIINPKCRLDLYNILLAHDTVLEIMQEYDIVLDCSDNVPTRYLLNDACVRLGKPLVSGSALKMDGQLTVYNYGSNGPCYRCIFPVPPPAETVNNCREAGILGVITGVIGALQALEAIKIALNGLGGEVMSGRLLIFDGAQSTFRNIRLRGRRPDCVACSDFPVMDNIVNYESVCGVLASGRDYSLNLLLSIHRISVHQYASIQDELHVLIDVRSPAEYELCKLPTSINIPLKSILNESYLDHIKEQIEDDSIPIFVICRRGNDSQIAVEHLLNKHPKRGIRDIIGGLHAWHNKIDKNFPYF